MNLQKFFGIGKLPEAENNRVQSMLFRKLCTSLQRLQILLIVAVQKVD